MKCILCNERNGSTRCEGCQQLYCLPCMNKHHEELAQQFQLLMDVRNELKQSLDMATSTSKNSQIVPCIVEIDRWEREIVHRIQEIARKARASVNEIMAKNIAEVRHRLEELSVDIQQRQKEGNHMENDIDATKNQLEQLRRDIEHINQRIHVDSTQSANTKWDTLIYIIEDDSSRKASSEPTQKNSTDIKAIKTKSLWDQISSQKDTTSSWTAASRKQTAADQQQQHPIQFPLRYGPTYSPPSSSNLIDFEHSIDQLRPCTVCKDYVYNIQSTGLCFECELNKKHPISRNLISNFPRRKKN